MSRCAVVESVENAVKAIWYVVSDKACVVPESRECELHPI